MGVFRCDFTGLVLVFAVAACGTAGSAPTGGVDGPVLRHQGGFTGDGEDLLIENLVQVEGDCVYLGVDGGEERYPVVWPASTSWDESNDRVVLPNGDSVGDGDGVYGGGGYHDLDYVRQIAGEPAADLAAQCLDNRFGEIAVINNQRGGVALDERIDEGD